MRVRFITNGTADLREYWEVEVTADELIDTPLGEVVEEALREGRAQCVNEQASGERERELEEGSIEVD